MLRGLSARSLRLAQMSHKGSDVHLVLRERKSSQRGKETSVELPCLCKLSHICPACISREYLAWRSSLPCQTDHLFVNQHGKPVSARGLAGTYAALSIDWNATDSGIARGHSPRVSGCRWWFRLGASLPTIGSIGDWTSMPVLKHYLGHLVQSQRLSHELQLKPKPSEEFEELRALIKSTLASKPPDPTTSRLSIVSCRKPRKWHAIDILAGSHTGWRTCCGDLFNERSMMLRPEFERPEGDSLCSICFWM